jgi:CheY-like chemotaxis protein
MLAATCVAFLVPAIIAFALALGTTPSDWPDGVRWSLYMLAAAALAAILGLIFGVPRARTDFSAQPSERYSSNSNLEQISDWLTKLLVGAGLVELSRLPELFRAMGDYLGAGMGVPNGEAYCVAAVAYGAGVGFGLGYLWARLLLRYLLEKTEKFAAAESLTDQLVAALRTASRGEGVQEPEQQLTASVGNAVRAAAVSNAFSPILWVDDTPSNNASLVAAFERLGIEVDQVVSTSAALERLRRRPYGLIITDLGRTEDGAWHDLAGRELIEAVRKASYDVPIFIFATRRALAMRQELEQAGAALVTNQAGQLFERAVDTCARRA